jgi:hypothetical protein
MWQNTKDEACVVYWLPVSCLTGWPLANNISDWRMAFLKATAEAVWLRQNQPHQQPCGTTPSTAG